MASQVLIIVCLLLRIWESAAEIGPTHLNKIIEGKRSPSPVPPLKLKPIPIEKIQLIKPVGPPISKNFVPLTEIPPPRRPGEPSVHYHGGRRHMSDDCTEKVIQHVYEGGKVDIWGDYYEEKVAKIVDTVVFPDHIDHKHFEIITQPPYIDVGVIEAIGYHPSTVKSDHPSECDKIYQDHIADMYSDETKDFSEESLEMARMPLFADPGDGAHAVNTDQENNMYEDVSQ